MVTGIIQPATADQVSAEALAQEAITRASTASANTVAMATSAIAHAATSKTPGIDPLDFVRADRIHVKDSSLFIDPYLVIHRHELAPEKEPKLREKLKLTYSLNHPSFYDAYDRFAIAVNLGQLVPVSLSAKHSKLMDEVNKYNAQVDSGVDADLAKTIHDKHHPFAAIVRDTLQHPGKDPVALDTLKNGLAMYLLMREKLTRAGYLEPLASYVQRTATADQVLGELVAKTGVKPLAVREAALKGGIDGVGALLGLDAAYIAEVKAVCDNAASHEFSYNQIEHWHLGRQLLKNQPSTMEQKLVTGMEARITAKIAEFRKQARGRFELPEGIAREQNKIAEALNLVEPAQRSLLYKLGYEISYTPEFLADKIAHYTNVFGLHRKTSDDMRDVRGTYRIFFSGRSELEESMRTFVHEVAHNLWPSAFAPAEVVKIDQLADIDEKRIAIFNRIVDEKFPELDQLVREFQAGNDAQKAATIAKSRATFAPYGVNIDEGLLPYLRDAQEFKFMVKYAADTLSVEGARYAKSGYDSTHARFREVISRFAEWKQVRYRNEPQLLQFVVPGLNQIWENHYIPHLARVQQKLETMQQTTPQGTPMRIAADAAPANDAGAPTAANDATITPPPVAANACTHEGTPDTKIDAGTVSMNPTIANVLGTLNTMGIHPAR